MEIKVLGASENVVAAIEGESELNLVFEREYEENDKIMITGCEGKYVWIMLDEALGKSLVYVKGEYIYYIPHGEKRCNISPKAFSGKLHLINVREAYDFEIKAIVLYMPYL